jgi:hypothetical protein
MVDCWASALGDCSSKQSKEHYVSKSLISSDHIYVRGLPWCSDELRRIPTVGFARNMLCQWHNSILAPVDQAGAHAFKSLCRFVDVLKFREAQRKRQKRLQQYKIDGQLLERWLLKTTINIAYGRELFGEISWAPPVNWVKIAFGRHPFAPDTGLYFADRGWQKARDGDRRIAIQLLDRDKELVGAGFDLNDFGIAIAMTPLKEEGLKYRPYRMIDKRRMSLQQVVNFHWK